MPGPSRLLPKKLPALSSGELDAKAQAVRAEVFARDRRGDRSYCRIPWCRRTTALEWAHLHARGMGGNPDGSRHTTANTIVACHSCHRGSIRSLHTGHIQWRFLSDRGADGPMVFEFHEEIGRISYG